MLAEAVASGDSLDAALKGNSIKLGGGKKTVGKRSACPHSNCKHSHWLVPSAVHRQQAKCICREGCHMLCNVMRRSR